MNSQSGQSRSLSHAHTKRGKKRKKIEKKEEKGRKNCRRKHSIESQFAFWAEKCRGQRGPANAPSLLHRTPDRIIMPWWCRVRSGGDGDERWWRRRAQFDWSVLSAWYATLWASANL